MSDRLHLTRRGFWCFVAAALSIASSRSYGQSVKPADRGIGGTGVAPSDAPGEDRGIGGTGVIGTIRRFGSIVVNGLRITFPKSVRVVIDGETATLGDLRLGHLVQVLARRHGGRLSTRQIWVTSEVVGPIASIAPRQMVVLGQNVTWAEEQDASSLREGDFVAISGLRRLDGTIAASRVERRARGPMRIAGPATRAADGSITIGALPLSGLDPRLIGDRVSAVGQLVDGTFVVEHAASDPSMLLGLSPAYLSIEGYVARADDGVRFGSGLEIGARRAPGGIPTAGAVRAVVLTRVEPDGRLSLDSIRVEKGSRGASGNGAPTGPGGQSPMGGQGPMGSGFGPMGVPGNPGAVGAAPAGSATAPTGGGAGFGPSGGFNSMGPGPAPGGFSSRGGMGGPGGGFGSGPR